MARQIILDTETTGLSPQQGHRIIEVGCVELIDRKFTNNTFHRYINPQRIVEQEAIEIHGITNDFLEDKPFFEDISDELLEYLKGAEIIIHNAPFDVGFLNHEFLKVNSSYTKLSDYAQITDSLVLARYKHPGQKNNLNALCRRYDVNLSGRELHGALLDAQLLGQVYLLMTGGQASLFTQDAAKASLKKEKEYRQVIKSSKLPVILPSAGELKAHEEFLQKIADKSGCCLWMEESEEVVS